MQAVKNFDDDDNDDDLLQPSLTPADDLVGIDAPWNPTHLLVITALFGIWAGGWLIARNLTKLGLGDARGRAWVLGIAFVAGLFTLGLSAWLAAGGQPDLFDPGNRHHISNLRTSTRAFGALVGMVLVWPQFRRWRAYEMSNRPRGPLFREAATAILATLLVTIAVSFALAAGLGWKVPA